jgi:hypothetical protein
MEITVNHRATKRTFAGKLVEVSGETDGIYWVWSSGNLRFGLSREAAVSPEVRAAVVAIVAAM